MAAQSTYTPIATYNAAGNSATFTFTNIPQNYTDLVIVWSALSTVNNSSQMSFTYTTNGGQRTLAAGGSGSGSSYSTTNSNYIYLANIPTNLSTTIPYSGIIYCNNYSNTNTYKTFLCKAGQDLNGSGGLMLAVASSFTTSGITSVGFSTNNGSNYFATASTFTLYGITAA